MNKKDLNINIFYLCVHKRLHDKIGLSRMMLRENFFRILGETYHIPHSLRVVILKEMGELNMIEEVEGYGENKKKLIKVMPLIIDPEENTNQFYAKVGLF